MNRYLFSLLPAVMAVSSNAQLPQVSAGSLRRHANFASALVSPRHVDVWLPEGYSRNKKYSVLYMHDGQMLFDAATTWNKQAWDADDAAAALIKAKKIADLIIVGIWNDGANRHSDYFPQKPFSLLTEAEQQMVLDAGRNHGNSLFPGRRLQSDNYLQFLVTELKPFIDSAYSTYTDRLHTYIAGSSMGGLISLYAVCEYPAVFGGAACLSTHWPGIFSMENNPFPSAMLRYLEKHLPDPGSTRLYFDIGTATLDSLYPPLQQKADEVLQARGYTGINWLTRIFPGEDHSENAWKRRLHIPLTFLIPPEP